MVFTEMLNYTTSIFNSIFFCHLMIIMLISLFYFSLLGSYSSCLLNVTNNKLWLQLICSIFSCVDSIFFFCACLLMFFFFDYDVSRWQIYISIVFFQFLSRKKNHLLKTKHKILVVVHSFSLVCFTHSFEPIKKKK